MEFPIASLPNEVLVVVFSHLSVKDRLRASLVCKKWYELLNCKFLLSDILVNIHCDEGILDFIPMTRRFVHFSFSDILVDKYFMKLLIHTAPFAQSMYFHKCDMDRKEHISVDDIPTFGCLTCLTVFDCDLWCLFPALPNLKELHLLGKSVITDDGIAILQKTMKQLEVFRIGCDIAFDHRAYKRFYPAGMTYEEKPSSLVLSFPAIKSFITERSYTLTEVNFEFNQLTASALEEFACIKGLKLTKISLHAFNFHKSLNVFFEHQANLMSFCIYGTYLENDSIIDALCRYLPNIKKLGIINCKITNHTLKQAFQLKELAVLNLGCCFGITDDGFYEAFSSFKARKLKKLNLCRINISQSSALLMKLWLNVVYLNVSGCKLTDDHVHIISAFLVNLNYLNIACNEITDYGLIGVTEAIENANELPEYDEENVYSPPLYNLKLLSELYLDFCPKLTEGGLIAAIKFPHLAFLSLEGIKVSCETAQVIHKNNPNLNGIKYDPYSELDPESEAYEDFKRSYVFRCTYAVK